MGFLESLGILHHDRRQEKERKSAERRQRRSEARESPSREVGEGGRASGSGSSSGRVASVPTPPRSAAPAAFAPTSTDEVFHELLMGIWRVWNRAVTASRTAAGLKATVKESEKQSEAENEFLAISAQAFSKGYTVQAILEVFSAEAAQHPDLYSEDYQEIFNQWLRLARLKWDLQAVRRSREEAPGEPDAKRPRSAPASPTGWLCCGEMRDFACMSCPACGQTQTNEPACGLEPPRKAVPLQNNPNPQIEKLSPTFGICVNTGLDFFIRS